MKKHNLTYSLLYKKYILEGKSKRGIALDTGYSPTTILSKLHKYNIKLRTVSQTNALRIHTENTRKKMSLAKYRGGKSYVKGYIYVSNNKHPYRNSLGKIAEHRLVMENYLGRYLTKEEVVHHINGIKDDNRIENLMLIKNLSEHMVLHNKLIKEED